MFASLNVSSQMFLASQICTWAQWVCSQMMSGKHPGQMIQWKGKLFLPAFPSPPPKWIISASNLEAIVINLIKSPSTERLLKGERPCRGKQVNKVLLDAVTFPFQSYFFFVLAIREYFKISISIIKIQFPSASEQLCTAWILWQLGVTLFFF